MCETNYLSFLSTWHAGSVDQHGAGTQKDLMSVFYRRVYLGISSAREMIRGITEIRNMMVQATQGLDRLAADVAYYPMFYVVCIARDA